MANRKRKGPRSGNQENSFRLITDLPILRRRIIAFQAVAEARRMLSPSYYIWHPANPDQQETKSALAREFLRDLEKEARRKGGRPGNPPGAHQNKRMLAVLCTLASGGSLKQFAEEETRGKDTTPQERLRALRVQLPKWCKRIYDAMIDEYTFSSHVKSATDAMIRHALQHWPGVDFPRHMKAFRYAIQQHLQSGNTIPK